MCDVYCSTIDKKANNCKNKQKARIVHGHPLSVSSESVLIIMRVVQILSVIFVLGIAFVTGAFMFVTHNRCIDFSALERYDPGKPSLLLDDNGVEWGRFQLDRRKPIAYKDIPSHLINAFLAIEDRAFFEHNGVSISGTVYSR